MSCWRLSASSANSTTQLQCTYTCSSSSSSSSSSNSSSNNSSSSNSSSGSNSKICYLAAAPLEGEEMHEPSTNLLTVHSSVAAVVCCCCLLLLRLLAAAVCCCCCRMSPAFQWAESPIEVFLNIKFAYRWSSPGIAAVAYAVAAG